MKSQDFTKAFISINFLNQEIFVKNGISKLAFLLGAKIVPVISYRDNNENSIIEFQQELGIENYNNKAEFLTKSIEDSYKFLENKIYEFPTQWTSWLTVHNLFMRNTSTAFFQNDAYGSKFNTERYSVFKLGKSNFIFDMFDYQSYPIEAELANAIQENNFSKISVSLLQELQDKNITI
jgi:hypothetical protein